MKIPTCVKTISIVVACWCVVSSTSQAASPEVPSLIKMINESSPDRQTQLALAFMRDQPWSRSRNSPTNTEILSLLRNPVSGYLQGKQVAAVLSAVQYDLPIRERYAAPIIDMTVNMRQAGSWWPSGSQDTLGALSYELHLCCHQEREWKDTLFLYWRGTVHEVPHNGVGNIAFHESRYLVIRTFVLGSVLGPPFLEDALEIWVLDMETNVLSKALHLTLTKGDAQRDVHTVLYGLDYRTAGEAFRPFDVYYREDIGEREQDDPYPGFYRYNSPYFIQESYEYDRTAMIYKRSQRQQIDGLEYIVTISNLSDASGKIMSFGGTTDIEPLFFEFRVYQNNADAILEKAKPLLKPVARDAVSRALSKKRPNKAL
jgi:hypothetical protein